MLKSLTPAKLSILMFVVVGMLILAYVGKSLIAKEEVATLPPTRNVPMAISDIDPGTLITENHIGLGPIRIDELDSDMLLSNRVIVGRIVKEKLAKATAIRANDLYPHGSRPPIPTQAGKQAVTISLGESVNLVDGLIKPGDHVDVYMSPVSLANDPRLKSGMVILLYEGLKILAINRSMQQQIIQRGSNSVTLEVTQQQAQVLILGQDKGRLTLTYNSNGAGPGGIQLLPGAEITLESILGLKDPHTPTPPYTVEAYKAGARELIQFDQYGRRLPWPDGSINDRALRTPIPPEPTDTNDRRDSDKRNAPKTRNNKSKPNSNDVQA